jgi:hypothetical protein
MGVMATSVYTMNKGINRPVEFRGLKAQWIWWLGGGLVVLLVLFAILYVIGVNTYLCLVVIVALGAGVFSRVYALSHRYGEHGLMKAAARRKVPQVVKVRRRQLFMQKLK